ncbi:DEAD/DEAH box helicase [Vibrio sp. S4M6]|uniref:DEAD/DEAH box helicase n=1 Tax=Vibrio sinus TaxID=2946865 RepID=UPI002029C573|nr:DEAD/DEAH box helicase [Vibrio sinus]MCL9782009.1 DEAD/DEAH box helicase [Vibrio sinus]
MLSLPIDSLETCFKTAIKSDHLVVEAETGSGKSTRLPVWASQYGRVLVIEPRRIACTSLAEFIAASLQQQLGKDVGYAIKLENRFNDQSNIVFVTPGVALRWFSENQLQDFDVIMIDEFHERRWDTDLLMAMLKRHDQHRVIVTSATMESEKLQNYVGAKRLASQGRNFFVDIQYRCNETHQLPSSFRLEQNVKSAIESVQTDGDLLVFLPGRKEITQCLSVLKGLQDTIVVPLHASVSEKHKQIALNQQSQKKVVLATNVAETSLTIPNITAVIDSGLERRTIQRNGRTTLVLTHISKASAKQRAGRAGRVADGVCIRLYGQYAALEAMTPPQLQREDLTEPMLNAAACGYILAKLDWLDLIPEKSLLIAQEKLALMEAIDEHGQITNHGKTLAQLPIDSLYADLVTRIKKRSLKEAMIDLTAAISVPASLYRLSGDVDSVEALKLSEPLGCDAALLIKLVRGQSIAGVEVDKEVLREAKGLAKQMRELFELPELEVASAFDRASLIEEIACLHPELVYVRREKRRESLANGMGEINLGRHSRVLSDTEAVLVLDFHSLPGRGVKQTLSIATVIMPVELTLLEKLGLGEWRQGESVVQDHVSYSQLELVYAGRVIASRQVEAKGSYALKPMLDAVVSEELLPGLAKEISTQIAYWKLYVELGLSDVKDHGNITFESWFVEQLSSLGLESIDDLQLFSVDDFQFDGIPYWEYTQFAQLYPFSLSLGDINLDVEYRTGKKLVYVVYRDGLRKTPPKRWELPRWQGWRVQFKKASRILDIR